jgi:undecaprenyl-phosphate galactose phosphotransferase
VGKGSQLLFKSLIGERSLGYEIVGFLDGNRGPNEISEISHNGKSAPVLGNLQEAEKLMNLMKTRDLLVDLTDTSNRREYINILAELQKTAESVTVVPDFQDLPMLGAKLDFLFSQRFFLLRVPSNLSKPWKLFIKTVFDFTVAGFLFLIILPILFLIALAVKIDSRGPIFFTQKRVGRKGKPFTCYKFRTMVHNAEEILKNLFEESPQAKAEWERNSKLVNDPRITKLGKLLRMSSLDELPQILNVLKKMAALVKACSPI